MKPDKIIVTNITIALLCMVSCMKDSGTNNNITNQNTPVTNIETVYATLYNHENPYDDYGWDLLYQNRHYNE